MRSVNDIVSILTGMNENVYKLVCFQPLIIFSVFSNIKISINNNSLKLPYPTFLCSKHKPFLIGSLVGNLHDYIGFLVQVLHYCDNGACISFGQQLHGSCSCMFPKILCIYTTIHVALHHNYIFSRMLSTVPWRNSRRFWYKHRLTF